MKTLEFIDLSLCARLPKQAWRELGYLFERVRRSNVLQELNLQFYGNHIDLDMRCEIVHQICNLPSLKKLRFGPKFQLPQNCTDVVSNTLLNTSITNEEVMALTIVPLIAPTIKPLNVPPNVIAVLCSHHILMELEAKHAREEDAKLIAELLHLNSSGEPKHVGLAKVALYLDINTVVPKRVLPHLIANGLARLSNVTAMYLYMKNLTKSGCFLLNAVNWRR
jgi:hypothetical protein